MASTTGCADHHGQPVVVTGLPALHFSSAASCCIILDCGTCHALHVLGHFGPLLLASLIYNASRSPSALMIWFIKLNSENTHKTSKTTRNRRK